MAMSHNFNISVDQLRVGMCVDLDLKWFGHPFAFSHFKFVSDEVHNYLSPRKRISYYFDAIHQGRASGSK